MNTVYISTNLLIVFELDIKPTGLDHPPSLCSWRIQFAEWKSTSSPKNDVGCAVTLRHFCYFILLVFAIFLSRSVSDFKPLILLWFSLPRLRGVRSVCICVCVCVAWWAWKADRSAPQMGFNCVQQRWQMPAKENVLLLRPMHRTPLHWSLSPSSNFLSNHLSYMLHFSLSLAPFFFF